VLAAMNERLSPRLSAQAIYWPRYSRATTIDRAMHGRVALKSGGATPIVTSRADQETAPQKIAPLRIAARTIVAEKGRPNHAGHKVAASAAALAAAQAAQAALAVAGAVSAAAAVGLAVVVEAAASVPWRVRQPATQAIARWTSELPDSNRSSTWS